MKGAFLFLIGIIYLNNALKQYIIKYSLIIIKEYIYKTNEVNIDFLYVVIQ
jgi:hypothetical protein